MITIAMILITGPASSPALVFSFQDLTQQVGRGVRKMPEINPCDDDRQDGDGDDEDQEDDDLEQVGDASTGGGGGGEVVEAVQLRPQARL